MSGRTDNKGRPRRIRTFDSAVPDELTHLVYVFDAASGEAAFWLQASHLTVVGSLARGGDLGAVDLVYVPEPSVVVLIARGFLAMFALR